MALSAIFAKSVPLCKGTFLLAFLFLHIHISHSQSPFDDKQCALLHSEPKLTGEQYLLYDHDQSVNLEEDHRASDTGWGSTGSINVTANCELKVCNETYFDGLCQSLNGGEYQVANLVVKNITSVDCTCKRECKCSGIFMKKSSCARGYLSGGCKTCNSLYTDLVRESTFLPDEFHGKIEALRIRKGCKLITYPEEEFEGDEVIYDEEIIEEDIAPFRSFECECNDALYVPKVKPPRSASYPPLIEIPGKLDDIVKMLAEKKYANHLGLQAARGSYIGGRSSKNAYILLLGTTGSGKSSAINLLFDNPNVTKVGGEKSTTTDIHEFRIPVPIDELGIANSELRVIDTPGLGDTRGLEQDSKFLATLDDYLTSHEELNDRIPNVVLIFHKFNDNRFNGEGSGFVKMIRGFDSFRSRITDENYSNVIFVLSHFCSETKAIRRRPDRRLFAFKEVIENYSLFPKPTVISVAENKAKDQDLPMVNGYFKLPNNEYYPRNLFEKLELVTDKGGDMIGLGVFRTAFRDSEDFNVSSSTFKLVEKGSNKVEKYLSILSNAFFGVEKTEISQLLQNVWDEKIDSSLKKQFPESLHYLQKALNIRNVNTKDDIPKTSTDILALLTAIKHNNATRTLLDKGLGIKPPMFPHNTIAGYSYNVFKDTYLSTSPFIMGDVEQSDIGFMIPKILTCKLEPGVKENFHIFESQQDYIHQRLKNLGIDGKIADGSFVGQLKPGHNIKGISLRNDSCDLSATREIRFFEFIVNDRLDLTPAFKNTVLNLPVFNESDHENVAKWTNFFNDYGTHVVRSVYGGGSIEIQLHSDKPFNQRTAEALFDLIKFAEDMSLMVVGDEDDASSENGSNSTSTGKTVLQEGISHSLKFVGGDQQYHTGDLTKMSLEKAAKLLTNWKKSLKFSPSVLTTEMRLVPISQIVRKLGQNYSSEIERATDLKFNSSIIYVPPKKHSSSGSGPGPARDDTPFMMELLKMQQQSNERMEQLMLELKRIEQRNEERRMNMTENQMKWEREQKLIEQKYRADQEATRRQDQAAREKMQADLEEKRLKHQQDQLERQQRYQEETRLAQQKANERANQLMIEILNRPQPKPSGGCLKPGSQILMADMTEKSVEDLAVGDLLLDKDLKPARLLGVSYEFLQKQKFYGFGNESSFFTTGHVLVGESGESGESDVQLYTLSNDILFQNTPLMRYSNVKEMSSVENLRLLHFARKSSSVVPQEVEVYEESQEYPEDTPIYFLHLDSPSGTYFANGFVCRHDIPPLEHWPNTMSVLFRLMDTPMFEKLSQLPYTLETAAFIRNINFHVAETIQEFLEERAEKTIDLAGDDDELELMTLDSIDMEDCISRIFSSPTVGAAGVTLYAKAGSVMSPYLDGEHNYNIAQIAKLQYTLYNLINEEFEKHLK